MGRHVCLHKKYAVIKYMYRMHWHIMRTNYLTIRSDVFDSLGSGELFCIN
jgi:TRAP-type C4-dicarboxylate transport system substrate-binding protein